MGVKPELAFDVCWEVYRGARDVLETKRGVSALNWKDTGKYLWRPDFRPRLTEWVVDFALAGQAALDGPDWASRKTLSPQIKKATIRAQRQDFGPHNREMRPKILRVKKGARYAGQARRPRAAATSCF